MGCGTLNSLASKMNASRQNSLYSRQTWSLRGTQDIQKAVFAMGIMILIWCLGSQKSHSFLQNREAQSHISCILGCSSIQVNYIIFPGTQRVLHRYITIQVLTASNYERDVHQKTSFDETNVSRPYSKRERPCTSSLFNSECCNRNASKQNILTSPRNS